MASIQEVVAGSFLGWKDAKDTLKDIRESGSRESQKVTFLGNTLINKYPGKLGDESRSAFRR